MARACPLRVAMIKIRREAFDALRKAGHELVDLGMSPEGAPVSPEDVITVAGEDELIDAIDRYKRLPSRPSSMDVFVTSLPDPDDA